MRRIVEMSDAFAIAKGDMTIPEAWIDLLTKDERERAIWRAQELRKGL